MVGLKGKPRKTTVLGHNLTNKTHPSKAPLSAQQGVFSMMPPAGNLPPSPSSEISPAGVEPAEVSGLVASSGFFASCTATRGGVTGRPFADPYKRRSNFQWGAKWKLPLSKLKTKQLKGTRQAKETRKVGKRGLELATIKVSKKRNVKEGQKGETIRTPVLLGGPVLRSGQMENLLYFKQHCQGHSLTSKAQTPCFLVEAGR